jgi:hypothetical protein
MQRRSVERSVCGQRNGQARAPDFPLVLSEGVVPRTDSCHEAGVHQPSQERPESGPSNEQEATRRTRAVERLVSRRYSKWSVADGLQIGCRSLSVRLARCIVLYAVLRHHQRVLSPTYLDAIVSPLQRGRQVG